MYSDPESAKSRPADELITDFDDSYVEDSYSLSEYACMYYMMTPTGCNQSNWSRSPGR